MLDPVVSVIIPTKNSAKTLELCLNSVKNQTYKNIEIIVVDNFSDDNTLDIARNFTNSIFSVNPERSTQVNYGAQKAVGKYVYRVDSDFIIEPEVLREAVNLAESKNYAAILIHNTSDPSVSFWAKVRKFERDMYDDDNLNVAVRFIRRDIFLLLGGLDPELTYGEDYDLHNRIIEKYSIGKINSKEMHLGEYKSLIEIAKKNYYYGHFVSRFIKKNRKRGIKQVNPFRKVYFKQSGKFLCQPTLMLGFLIYQTVRYFSGSIGLLAYFLSKFSK